jgi:hypothetical protein
VIALDPGFDTREVLPFHAVPFISELPVQVGFQVEIGLDETRQQLVLKLPDPIVGLGARDVEVLCDALADKRRLMEPPVPDRPPTDVTIYEASCNFALETSTNRLALSVRHPGYGWLHVLLPQGIQADLLKWLQERTPEAAAAAAGSEPPAPGATPA